MTSWMLEQNVVDYVLRRASLWGDRTAQVDSASGQRITFSDVSRMTANVAHKLQSQGVAAGSVVAICAENCLEYAAVVLGVLRVGATAALYSPAWKTRELRYYTEILGPTWALSISREQNPISELFPEIKHIKCSLEEMLKDESAQENPPKIITNELNKPAILFASSGTTGDPKFVKITHLNLINAYHNLSHILMENKKTAMGLTPFYHAYGFGLMIMALCEGSTIVVMSKYIPEEFANIFLTYKITHFHTVSTFLTRLVDGSIDIYKLKSVRHIFTSACQVSPEIQAAVLNKLGNKVKMYHFFGMTELTNTVTFGEVDPNRPGSVGCTLPFMKAKIIGHQGETLESGKHGELCLTGPTVMEGYSGNKQATEKAFTEDGWLRTGDLAWMDNDGYIYILDRIKHIIKFQGYQVAPSELEKVILQLPCVSEVVVVGVPHEKYGEVPKAFVVRKDEELSENEIINAVNSQLSYYKWLRGGVRFVDSIPKTPLLKVMKKHLIDYV